jgi:hypothetical protein
MGVLHIEERQYDEAGPGEPSTVSLLAHRAGLMASREGSGSEALHWRRKGLSVSLYKFPCNEESASTCFESFTASRNRFPA